MLAATSSTNGTSGAMTRPRATYGGRYERTGIPSMKMLTSI